MAQDFSQVLRIDFTKIFAPSIRQESLTIFLVIAILLDLISLNANGCHWRLP